MADSRPAQNGDNLARTIRALAAGDAVSDGELVQRVAASGDPAAFECLVWRHGPMMRGVCLRVLRNEADADDATQAAFLVLLRRPGDINPPSRVGAWLHGVALQTAIRLRHDQARRRAKEQLAARSPEANDGTAAAELAEAIDREIDRLPDRFRLPIVLCELRGQSIRATADQLGWPQGTVASRLARGREMLAGRMRGLAAVGGAAVVATATPLAAALVERTLRMTGDGGTAAMATAMGSVSSAVIQTLWWRKMKPIIVAAAMACLLLTAGLWTLVAAGPAESPTRPQQRAEAALPFQKDDKKEPTMAELLPGRWRLVREERGGKTVEKPTTQALDFENLEFLKWYPVETGIPTLWRVEWIKNQPGAIAIGWLTAGRFSPSQAINEIKNGVMRICMGVEVTGAPPKEPRPTDFTTAPDNKRVLWELEREEIAWGKADRGIELGLGLKPETVRHDDRVVFRIYARNATNEVAKFDFPYLDFCWGFGCPVMVDSKGKTATLYRLLPAGVPPEIRYTQEFLFRDATKLVGEVKWFIRSPDAKPDNDPSRPAVLAEPGQYAVRFEGIPLKGPANFNMTTGTLKLKLAPAAK